MGLALLHFVISNGAPALASIAPGVILLTLMVRIAVAAGQPPGASVVNVSKTVPLKPAAGVKVTEAGSLVWEVLLNVPLPDVMDQAPVLALPPIPEPVKVIGVGEPDWQTVFGPPALAVGASLTLMIRSSDTAPQGPDGSSLVSRKVTVPVKFEAGV